MWTRAANRWLTVLLVPAVIVLAAGLGVALGVRSWQGGGGSDAGFPEFVYQSPEAERAYRLAVAHPRLFSEVACYCGCVNLAVDPHRNLFDCFVNDDGTFDPHAVGCAVCADIAGDAVAWQRQGNSADEVSALVDQKYRSYGPPTHQ